MDRHLLAASQIVLVSGELVTHLLDRESAPQESAGLTVLREDQVMVLERSSCANTRGLLAELRHVERNTRLALRCVVDHISLVDCDHLVIHLQQLVIRNLVVVAWRHDLALLVEHPEALDFVE